MNKTNKINLHFLGYLPQGEKHKSLILFILILYQYFVYYYFIEFGKNKKEGKEKEYYFYKISDMSPPKYSHIYIN